MALKKIHTTRVGSRCAVNIYRNAEYDEWVVKTAYGARQSGGYYTNDKQDARNTAASIVRDLRKRTTCRA